jgi:hypothetical protein
MHGIAERFEEKRWSVRLQSDLHITIQACQEIDMSIVGINDKINCLDFWKSGFSRCEAFDVLC